MKFGSLFAGIGGIDLGLERAGMECAWQVEIDDYCQRVLTKHWPDVERFGDVKEVGKHNLEAVDLIAGGFPCQPHSVAGKRKGAADDRNLWPEYSRIIAELRPRYILAENVPGIISTYLDTVLSDLEGQGYASATVNLPALAFDAPHRRERVFIVAHTNRTRKLQPQRRKRTQRGWPSDSSEETRTLADTDNRRRRSPRIKGIMGEIQGRRTDIGCAASESGSDVADAEQQRLEGHARDGNRSRQSRRKHKEAHRSAGTESVRTRKNSYAQKFAQWARLRKGRQGSQWGRRSSDTYSETSIFRGYGKREDFSAFWQWWTVEPDVGRVAHGIPARVDRLRGLGNAVVPQVASWIGERIIEHAEAQANSLASTSKNPESSL